MQIAINVNPMITFSSQFHPPDMKRPAVAKGSHDFLYSESKRAKLEREKEERRRRREEEIEFAPEDLALATVPGGKISLIKALYL